MHESVEKKHQILFAVALHEEVTYSDKKVPLNSDRAGRALPCHDIWATGLMCLNGLSQTELCQIIFCMAAVSYSTQEDLTYLHS